MGMGSGPIGGKGGTNLSQQPGANAGPPRSAASTQYTQPFQQQYRPPQQMQFSMPAPQQRQMQMSPNNLAGIMGVSNLADQQTNMPRQYYTFSAQPQQQAGFGQLMGGPMGGLLNRPHQGPGPGQFGYGEGTGGAPQMSQQQQQMLRDRVGQLQQQPSPQQQRTQQQQQYFRPQQYQQDPYMNYVRNQQQAIQQQAMQQAGIQQAQQAEVLRQQQAAQQGARLIAQRTANAPAPTYNAPDWQAG